MMEPRFPTEACAARVCASLVRTALVLAAGFLGVAACDAAELNPSDIALIDRLTWGINASTAAHFQAVGAERWLAEQLHPAPGDALPAAARSRACWSCSKCLMTSC